MRLILSNRRLWCVMAALAIGTLILGVLFLSRPKRITLDNVNKIQVGMSEAELTEMLGPSGDYSSRPWISHASNAPNAAYCRQWISDDCALFVEFDSKDRVITYTMSAGLKRDWLSWLDWLRP